MYDFRIEKDLTAFDNFAEANKGSYLQCSKWAEVKKSWDSRFYSGFFGEERILTCLVLSRVLPVAGEIWYIPCGPLCDYKNEGLQKEFTEFIKGEVKKAGATCLLIDPLIPLRIDGEICEDGIDAHKLLTSCGYTLNPKIETYTYKHPVQTYIPLKDMDGNMIPADKILKNCEKGVRYSVRIGTTRGLESKLYTYEDVKNNPQIMDDFMSVMHDTSNRNDFVSRDGDYCKNLMEKFKDNLDLVSNAIDKNSEAVKNLPKALEQIKEIIQKTDDEIVRITESLSDMDDMGKTAKETLPEAISEIKRVADNAITQTKGLSDKALALIQNTTTVVSDNSEVVMAHTKKLIDNTGTQINAMSEESITKIDDVSKKAFGAITEMGDKAAQVVPDMKKSLNNMVEETNNELESLGGHIVGITQKLVSNFQELSDTLEVATKKNK